MSKSVLVVMGVGNLSGLVVNHLRSRNMVVTSVQTLELARKIVETISFDDVVCSAKLPDGDGLAFLSELRASLHHQKAGRFLLGPESEEDQLRNAAVAIGAMFFVESSDAPSTIASLIG